MIKSALREGLSLPLFDGWPDFGWSLSIAQQITGQFTQADSETCNSVDDG